MSVGSYQHSQHNHLQPKSQLPHFDNGQNPAQFIPPNGTNNENVHIAGNEVKYAEQVNDHHLASGININIFSSNFVCHRCF